MLNQRRVRLKHVGLCARNTAKQSHSPLLCVMAPSWNCSQAVSSLPYKACSAAGWRAGGDLPGLGTVLVMDCGTLSFMSSTHSLGKKPTWWADRMKRDDIRRGGSTIFKKKNYCVKCPVWTFLKLWSTFKFCFDNWWKMSPALMRAHSRAARSEAEVRHWQCDMPEVKG